MALFGGDKVDISLDVDKTDLVPGDTVRVRVDVGEPDKRTRGGRVELRYENTYYHYEYESNAGHDNDFSRDRRKEREKEDVVVAVAPLWEGPPTAGVIEVELVLPADAPPTVEGMVDWELRALVDRKLGGDAGAEEPLTVHSSPDALAAWAQRTPEVSAGAGLSLTAEPRAVRAGDTISGTVTIRPTSQEVEGRALRIELEKVRIEKDDITDFSEEVEQVLLEDVRLVPGEQRELPFEVEVPAGAEASAQAANNQQHWYLKAVVDRKMRGDQEAKLEVVVLT